MISSDPSTDWRESIAPAEMLTSSSGQCKQLHHLKGNPFRQVIRFHEKPKDKAPPRLHFLNDHDAILECLVFPQDSLTRPTSSTPLTASSSMLQAALSCCAVSMSLARPKHHLANPPMSSMGSGNPQKQAVKALLGSHFLSTRLMSTSPA